jgi:hypothetical protein
MKLLLLLLLLLIFIGVLNAEDINKNSIQQKMAGFRLELPEQSAEGSLIDRSGRIVKGPKDTSVIWTRLIEIGSTLNIHSRKDLFTIISYLRDRDVHMRLIAGASLQKFLEESGMLKEFEFRIHIFFFEVDDVHFRTQLQKILEVAVKASAKL